jgi:hypothetical protein
MKNLATLFSRVFIKLVCQLFGGILTIQNYSVTPKETGDKFFNAEQSDQMIL